VYAHTSDSQSNSSTDSPSAHTGGEGVHAVAVTDSLAADYKNDGINSLREGGT